MSATEPYRPRPPRREVRLPANLVTYISLGLIVLVLLLVITTGRAGILEIEDTEAAVLVNYLTGKSEVVVDPGYQIFLPFVVQGYVFDKSPQEFVMSGDVDMDANHVAKLTVRANDGSNFWFDEIKIQYELLPDRSNLVLADSGTRESFKQNWVRAYARSILRDEFGRYSAVEVADPTVFRLATSEAERLLNEVLEPHGLNVIQIITPRPKFEESYERAIEDRKVANQEVEKLKTRANQLIQERERRLAEIESKRSVEFEALKGQLEASRIDAERERVRVEKSADAYRTRLAGQGEAMRAAMVEEARGLREKAEKEAEGLREITQALEVGGEVLVRERLVSLLSKVQFSLLPYNRDPSPTRIELLDDANNGGSR